MTNVYKMINSKLGLVLFISGAILLAHAFYMDAKAKLAQILIAHSWALSANGSHTQEFTPKPWWWADTRVIAKLDIPRLQKTLYVMQDDSGESLAFGPGHLPGSARPSQSGHVMLAGHRDSHFAFLESLTVGDLIHTTNLQGKHKTYRIEQTQLFNINTDQLYKLDDDLLSLITCYPFDGLVPGGPMRYIVHARPVFENTQSLTQQNSEHLFTAP